MKPREDPYLALCRSIARLVAIAAGAYPLGIGIAYFIEAARLWLHG
jgi:hypothetical protein